MSDSGFQRMFGVLFAPGKTFRAIAERPTWFWPLAVLALLLALNSYLMYQRVDLAAMVRQQGQSQGMSEEQLAQQEEVMETVSRYMPAAFAGMAVIGTPLFFLLVSLLLWGGFRLLGSELTFRQSFATWLHAYMPFAVSTLLAIPIVLGRQEVTMGEAQSGGVLASHLGALAPEGTGPVGLALLSSVDFFSLWTIVLLVLGYRTTARVKTGTAAILVLAAWMLGVGLKVAGSALGAGFGR